MLDEDARTWFARGFGLIAGMGSAGLLLLAVLIGVPVLVCGGACTGIALLGAAAEPLLADPEPAVDAEPLEPTERAAPVPVAPVPEPAPVPVAEPKRVAPVAAPAPVPVPAPLPAEPVALTPEEAFLLEHPEPTEPTEPTPDEIAAGIEAEAREAARRQRELELEFVQLGVAIRDCRLRPLRPCPARQDLDAFLAEHPEYRERFVQ